MTTDSVLARPPRLDFALLGVAVAAISASAPIIAAIAAPALAIAFWRCILGAGATGAWVALRQRSEISRLTWHQWRLVILAGLLLGAHFATWIPSLRFTSVASSTALVATQPVWAALIARARGVQIPGRTWVGIAIVSVAILVETLAPDDVTIVPISNRRDLWDDAARWSVEAWRHEFPDDTVQTYLDQYALTQDPQGRLIEVYAAVDRRGSLRGLATLVDDDDLPNATEPGPWLAAVFVHPDVRRCGIGSRLVDHVTSRAATLGHETLYLYTEHSVDWYRSKGWTIVRDTTLNGLPHVVMSRML
ncbi:MAG: GNAT family N-acetyltransferase [Actinomycetales bacterium]